MSTDRQQTVSPDELERLRAETRAELRSQLRSEARRSRRRLTWVAGALAALMLSLNMGPVVASHLTVRTSDIVNKAVTTKKLDNQAVNAKKLRSNAVKTAKIKNGAVTGPKVANGAVTSPKIAERSVTSTKIAQYVPGIALGGVNTQSFGADLVTWFNRFGGTPTVTNIGVGEFSVTFPGLEGRLGPDAIVNVTAHRADGFARHLGFGGTNEIQIRTFDAAGTPTNRSFNLTVVAPNNANAVDARPSTTPKKKGAGEDK